VLSKTIQQELNDQISREFKASNDYLALASWCESEGYEGTASFFYSQSNEERDHGMRIFHFINGLGGHAIAPQIDQPDVQFKSYKGLFEQALEYERDTTAKIHELVELCLQEKDYSTYNFLHWYLDEQVEEENTFRSILDKLKIIGDDRSGIYLLDKDLGERGDTATDIQ